jgi:hypothetical protein
LEADGDLVSVAGESLAAAQGERDPRPAPVVDGERHGGERLGAARRVDARLVDVGRDVAVADAAGDVACAQRPFARVRSGGCADAAQDIDLAIAEVALGQRRGWLHRDQREELQ